MNLNNRKKICFLSGTRADYGKIKRVMQFIEVSDDFELFVFVTGMHMHKEYGGTYSEILKDKFKNVYLYMNHRPGLAPLMELNLASTIEGFSAYIDEIEPDLIIVHGDRVEALAAAIVGAMNNIYIGHIEGGEVSGTIDESVRHAITKLAHFHFVANNDSKKRVEQLGELSSNIFVIGSPDIDVMISPNLPTWKQAKDRYDIQFNDYAIAMFHPVTTSYKDMSSHAKSFTSALKESNKNYIIIHPNNDLGRQFIIEEYDNLRDNPFFRIFSSIRFEYFLTMLKNAEFIIGNSSAGVREASVYGIPAIDVGDRQKNRYQLHDGIVHCNYSVGNILKAIHNRPKIIEKVSDFGGGESAERFVEAISNNSLWELPIQKIFIDID